MSAYKKAGVWALLLLGAALGLTVLDSRSDSSVRTSAVATTALRGTAAYRVSFERPVSDADVQTIEEAGVRIIDELPQNELIVEASPATVRRLWPSSSATNSTSPTQATCRPLARSEKIQSDLDLTSPTPRLLTVLPLADQDLETLERQVAALGGAVVERVGLMDGLPRLRVRLAGTSIGDLADEAEVKWIEGYARPRFLNDVAVGPGLMNITRVREDLGLTGEGQVVTTSDSGIDTGDFATMHADLRTNVIGFAKTIEGEFESSDGESTWTTEITSTDVSGHGTHTAGSIVGTGAKSNGQFKGAAPAARLWAWFCGGADDYVYTPDSFDELFHPSALGPTNAYIHSASWGGSTNFYSTESQALDNWCWNHPDFLPVFAAGNSGADRTICEQGAAKNVLCVGATESYRPSKGGVADNPNQIAYFSSRGPMPDGRMKPDICAPGSYIVSTRSSQASSTGWGVYNSDYLYNSGTSMATPLTAGAVALVRQWLVEEAGFTNRAPSSALMKAVLTGGAMRLGDSAPNKSFGWGRADVAETVAPTNGLGVGLQDYIPFSQGSSETFTVTTTNVAPLDVQLCWIDYPASTWSASRKSLVIDLDLEVTNISTGEVLKPNDHVNNLESVHIDAALPGTYSIVVKGYSTNRRDSTQGGAAAVYVRGAFEKFSLREPEYATLTVSAEGGGDHCCKPSVGVHDYVKGTTVTLTAGKYEDEDGEDYHASSFWGLEVARYPFVGWTRDDGSLRQGTERTVTLTLTNDVTLTWRWQESPSEVALWLESCDDFRGLMMYPDYPTSGGTGYWIPYGEELTIMAEDSPMLDNYPSADGGMTVPVNGNMYVNYRGRLYRYSYGTLRFTSFRVLDEGGNQTFVWDETNHYRLAQSVTLPMTSFTAIDFGYADETDQDATIGLPFWWWARYLWGPYMNGVISAEASYATGDADGDTSSNRMEYRHGTDPMDSKSRKLPLGLILR